jgi:hypothetical protein
LCTSRSCLVCRFLLFAFARCLASSWSLRTEQAKVGQTATRADALAIAVVEGVRTTRDGTGTEPPQPT